MNLTPARTIQRVAHTADIDRFWSKIQMTIDCWLWTAGKVQGRYGAFQLSGTKRAHILVYEILVGEIPKGLVLDHLCKNQACVNPAHLEPVTQGENVRRGDVWKINGLKTHCPKGHEYTKENTLRWPSQPGSRRCRTCHNIRTRLYQQRKRS